MTKAFTEAMEKVAELPPDEQDAIAAILLDELASERRWHELFSGSQDLLEELAEEARQEDAAGDTEPLDSLPY